MVDSFYEWHKEDLIDPGPPKRVGIKVNVEFRGRTFHFASKNVTFND